MQGPRRACRNLNLASVLVGSLISLAIRGQETLPIKRGDANLENGGRLYGMHCLRCHGPDGDDIACMDLVPLAGLARRPRVDLVKSVLSPSYFFRGVPFEGGDARDLTAFLISLKGEKGFDDPGLRCMPRLLSARCDLFNHYRVIDVRGEAAYAKGHVPNAERWPDGTESGPSQPRTADLVRQKLGLLAVHPGMSIVIYDDTVTPAAAQLWWDLVRAGHSNVAILDGGFRSWGDEEYNVTTTVTRVVPSAYGTPAVTEVPAVAADRAYPQLHLRAGLPQPSSGVFDWQRTLADGQLSAAADIREYLKRSEISFPGTYRVDGSDAEASFLVYLLHLLGQSGSYYDPVSKVLVADNSERHVRESRTP